MLPKPVKTSTFPPCCSNDVLSEVTAIIAAVATLQASNMVVIGVTVTVWVWVVVCEVGNVGLVTTGIFTDGSVWIGAVGTVIISPGVLTDIVVTKVDGK
jgi:acyl dehydratase